MRRAANAQRGFTLPELVIVLILIGILSALAVPRLNIGPAQDRIAAGQVLDAARHARRVAIQSGCAVQVLADAAADRFTATFTGAGGVACPAGPVPDPARGGPLAIDAAIAGGGSTVFDARGRAGGLTVTFDAGMPVRIEAGSGYVHR